MSAYAYIVGDGEGQRDLNRSDALILDRVWHVNGGGLQRVVGVP
jgi:hypothetical protein